MNSAALQGRKFLLHMCHPLYYDILCIIKYVDAFPWLIIISLTGIVFGLCSKKVTSYNANKFLNYSEPLTKQQERWKEELNTGIENWDLLYKVPFYCTNSNKLTLVSRQNIAQSTRSLLFKCRLKEPSFVIFAMKKK